VKYELPDEVLEAIKLLVYYNNQIIYKNIYLPCQFHLLFYPKLPVQLN